MADKMEFLDKLNGILSIAIANDYKITPKEVEVYFEEDSLSAEQLQLVFDYLLAQKVAVKGYEKTNEMKEITTEESYTDDEKAYLNEYEADIQAICSAKSGEIEALCERIIKGDALAKSRMTELYLQEVVAISKTMYHTEIFIGDMIQEGNVSLMVALEMLPDISEIGMRGIQDYLEAEVRQGIQMLIEETTDLKSRDQRMVEKVEELDQTITKLTEDLGRKVTIDELALYLEMNEEEILEVLKLTGEEVEEQEESETGLHASDLGIQVLEQ
ncbi:MAG: sigma-70 domain-containing protein [Eubacteriales bacterium]